MYDYSCKNCGDPNIEEGYETNLCNSCREKLVKRPIPIWLKGLGILILVIMIYSVLSFKGNIGAIVSYERALDAEKENRYNTAELNYEKTFEKYQDSNLVITRLFIAKVYNENYEDAIDLYDKYLAEKEYTNDSLFKELEDAYEILFDAYFLGDELYDLATSDLTSEDKIEKYIKYIDENPDVYLANIYLGNTYSDLGDYENSKNSYRKAIKLNPKNPTGKLNLASIYIDIEDYENAKNMCDSVLKLNNESVNAYCMLSSMYIRKKDYKKSLELMQKAYSLQNENLYVLDNLVLSYHFNDMEKERDEVFAILKEKDYEYVQYIQDVIDGKDDYYK